MQDSLTLDLSALPDQPKAPVLDLSLLPDKPDPALQEALGRAQLLDQGGPKAGADPAAYLQQQQLGEQFADKISHPENDQLLSMGNTPSDAVIRAPHDNDDFYNKLLENATSDEEVMAAVFSKPLVDAMKRLYSPDTTSPKALAAAQNAIAIYQTTGISPVLTLENPDAVNQALFGTGNAREEFLMNMIGMFGLGAFAEAANPLAAAAGLTRYVRATDAAGEALKLRDVGESLLPATESIYKGWGLPLGIAGYTAEENANALVRSYIEGKPFAETKPYGLHDILPPQASEGAKAAVDLLDMFGKFKAMHAGFEGLQSLWDALAYDKVSQVVTSQKLYIPAEAIRNHFGASNEGSAGEYYDIIQNLQKEGMLSNGQIKDAINYGLDVEVPLSRIVGSMDAPWFAKIKDFLRISPYEEVYEVPAGKPEARLHVSGELEAPAVLTEVGAKSPVEIASQPPVETSVPDRKLTPPESEGSPVAAFESEVTSPPVQAQKFKNSDDYLQSLGFAKGWTPDGENYDALVPFINEASGKYGVPANIIEAVVWKESNYHPDIVYGKRVGASGDSGAMQLIPETARAMGVEDVFDPAQNIDGGTKYLRTLYDRFGDWGKAVAAYNSGAASKFFADNPEAKIGDAPNYSAYVKPVLDAAEKFATGSEPQLGITSADVWDRRKGATPNDRYGRLIAGTQKPMAGEPQGEYVKLTETPEFKNWFGDSKAVFKEGESDPFQNPEGITGIPRMVYHGTHERHSSDLFRPDEKGVISFTTSPDVALQTAGKGGDAIPAYVKLENPLEIKSTGVHSIDDAAIDKAREQGNDGVIFDRFYGNYTYAVFSPDQVKSPLNRGIFNPGDADILNEAGRSYVEESNKVSRVLSIVARAFKGIAKRPVEVISLPVNSHADLAVLAQGWRNPNYEELRYVYMRQGIIVDHEGVTCRLPMMSKAFLGDRLEGIKHIKERIAALGADSLHLVHNHSAGHLKPSGEDLNLTVSIGMEVPEMKGHIIINSGEYIFIDPKGEYKLYRLPGLPKKWVDPILTPSVPHKMLNKRFMPPGDIAAWTKALTGERNKPLIVYLSPGFKVRGLHEINPGGTWDWNQLADVMPKKLVDFGSAHAVLILPERSRSYMLEIGETLVRRGVFYDVVCSDKDGPHSVLEIGTNVQRNVFGGRPLTDFPAQSIR
jgi:hypothetical protein